MPAPHPIARLLACEHPDTHEQAAVRIRAAIRKTKGDVPAAAAVLDVHRATLYRWIRVADLAPWIAEHYPQTSGPRPK